MDFKKAEKYIVHNGERYLRESYVLNEFCPEFIKMLLSKGRINIEEGNLEYFIAHNGQPTDRFKEFIPELLKKEEGKDNLRWVKVSERMPTIEKDYIVRFWNGTGVTMLSFEDGRFWSGEDEMKCEDDQEWLEEIINSSSPNCAKDPNTCQVSFCGWPHQCGEEGKDLEPEASKGGLPVLKEPLISQEDFDEYFKMEREDTVEAVGIVKDFAEWSLKYPKGRTYPYSDRIDEQLEVLEQRAKDYLNKINKYSHG